MNQAIDWGLLRNYGITLFALLNPLGMLPIFVNYVSLEKRRVQQIVAFYVSVTVLILLLIFAIFGNSFLQFFGVSLNSFRIAGGILLLVIGIDIVNSNGSASTSIAHRQEQDLNDVLLARSVYRKIVVPMAMPLLVGPGVIANVILSASEAAKRAMTIQLILVTLIVSILVFIILASGKTLQHLLGMTGLSIMQRVMGLFVAAIGVQFVVTGLLDIFTLHILPQLQIIMK